eukprot:5916256-Prorocentrum_lima.AAC.1
MQATRDPGMVIDFACGIGGFTEAAKALGLQVEAAVDISTLCCFPHTSTFGAVTGSVVLICALRRPYAICKMHELLLFAWGFPVSPSHRP